MARSVARLACALMTYEQLWARLTFTISAMCDPRADNVHERNKLRDQAFEIMNELKLRGEQLSLPWEPHVA